jgi:hypothetical protein
MYRLSGELRQYERHQSLVVLLVSLKERASSGSLPPPLQATPPTRQSRLCSLESRLSLVRNGRHQVPVINNSSL